LHSRIEILKIIAAKLNGVLFFPIPVVHFLHPPSPPLPITGTEKVKDKWTDKWKDGRWRGRREGRKEKRKGKQINDIFNKLLKK